MTNFTPGPSQLYFTINDHVRQAFRDGIPSLSHRSKQFESIFQATREGLKSLLGIPDDYFMVFTGSATETWERSIQNLVANQSLHLVNGAFSKRYWEIAQQLNKQAEKQEVAPGKSFDSVTISTEPELIALTHNETSAGVSLSTEFIHSFKKKYPTSLVVVDAVSSLPYPSFDYNRIDSVFFSVQKGFGLPAGLGVWLINDRCVAKAEKLLSSGNSIGSYHSIPQLVANARKHQTPETPNVLGIYLLSKVIEDFQRRGIELIRKETEYKAAILYGALADHALLKPFVQKKEDRSKTVVVADCGEHTKPLTTFLQSKGFYPGDGYGAFKSTQLRFANFPAHSKEQFEALVDALQSYR